MIDHLLFCDMTLLYSTPVAAPRGWGEGGGQGGLLVPPMISFFSPPIFFFFWLVSSAVMAMIIPLPHYENFCWKSLWSRGKKNVSESHPPPPHPPHWATFPGLAQKLGSRRSSKTFPPPPPKQTPWRRPCSTLQQIAQVYSCFVLHFPTGFYQYAIIIYASYDC